MPHDNAIARFTSPEDCFVFDNKNIDKTQLSGAQYELLRRAQASLSFIQSDGLNSCGGFSLPHCDVMAAIDTVAAQLLALDKLLAASDHSEPMVIGGGV